MNTKTILFAATLVASTSPALAGGFLTNTNHGASFLRMPAQEGYISIEGAYYNPAGIGFLGNGWHFAFNNQSAFQTRTVQSTFPAFAYGLQNGGQMTKRYKGTATAPILPAVDLGYVSDRWFGSFHFGVVGGGGKCEFEDGLGSFESVVSVVPSALNGMTQAMLGTTDPMVGNGYGLNTYMRGKQFFLGAQIGVGYKVLHELSVSLGGRLVYATSNYYGYVKDIQLTTPAGQPVGVTDVLAGMATQSAAHFPDDPTLPARIGYLGQMIGQVEVNCDQKGWGFAPIIGVDYKKGPLTLGARYEFKTRLRLKNQSDTTAELSRLLSNVA
ncbi:MAG: transporter, partial [Alloprevotella sp.]|nr:transporter [Alloprevotella sp.]